jgi:NitT/TauT family transport system ATP-binding protein
MQPDTRIEFQDVTKRFGDSGRGTAEDVVVAVEDVSLQVRDREVVSLIGPSGCGKSTLLNMGSGLYPPSEGRVYIDGELVSGPNRHVAFMLQKDLLLPWRTIRENVEVGLEIRKVGREERYETAIELLDKCHLGQFADHYPHQLSGGMRPACASAPPLPVPWPSILPCCSWTSRSRRSTPRPRWCFSRTWRSAWPTPPRRRFSSPMTSPNRSPCRTASWS